MYIHFRSHGGSDDRTNLAPLCWFHHRQGIHSGRIVLEGSAPDGLLWRIGVDSEGEHMLVIGRLIVDSIANERIESYRKHEHLYEGRHKGVFAPRPIRCSNGRTVYIVVNAAAGISNASADFLFGESPSFRVGGPGSPEQATLDSIVQANDLQTTLHESALSASFRGDTIFRVRFGPREPGQPGEVIVEELPAYSYCYERNPDNVRVALSQSIVWVRCMPGQRQHYLRVETHTAGRIEHRAYRYSPDTQVIGEEVSLEQVYPDGDAPPPEEETGVTSPLLVHVPNFRHGSRYYGISDYDGHTPLMEALNNRITQIDRILDRHASPKLVGLPGMSDPRGIVDAEALEFIEADSALFKDIPRYVTWDANLTSAFQEYEQLLLTLCRMTEISPAVFGINDGSGGTSDSGVALRMRFFGTERKSNRKKRYFDRRLKRVLRVALEMSAARLGTPAPEREPEIIWQDGLPQIYPEAVQTEATRVAAGLSSKISAIQRLDGGTSEDAEAELERIREEAASDPNDISMENVSNGGSINQAPAEDDTETDGAVDEGEAE